MQQLLIVSRTEPTCHTDPSAGHSAHWPRSIGHVISLHPSIPLHLLATGRLSVDALAGPSRSRATFQGRRHRELIASDEPLPCEAQLVVARYQQMPHRSVLGPHPGHEALDATKSGGCDGCRQQERPDTVVLDAIIDGHGQLLGPVAERLEHEVTNDPAARHGDEAVAQPVIGRGELLGLIVTEPTGRAVETLGAAVSREFGVEPLEYSGIARDDPADTDVIVEHAPIVAGSARWRQCRASPSQGPSGTGF